MLRMLGSIVAVSALLVAHPLAQGAQAAKPMDARRAAQVNLNTATAPELEVLPGIGAKTAARIIDYRQKKGPFKKIEEILETSSSCPCLLGISALNASGSVSRSRQKSQ